MHVEMSQSIFHNQVMQSSQSRQTFLLSVVNVFPYLDIHDVCFFSFAFCLNQSNKSWVSSTHNQKHGTTKILYQLFVCTKACVCRRGEKEGELKVKI